MNSLALLAVSLDPRHILPFIRGHPELVPSDNITVVVHMNRQGGLQSPQFHRLIESVYPHGEIQSKCLKEL